MLDDQFARITQKQPAVDARRLGRAPHVRAGFGARRQTVLLDPTLHMGRTITILIFGVKNIAGNPLNGLVDIDCISRAIKSRLHLRPALLIIIPIRNVPLQVVPCTYAFATPSPTGKSVSALIWVPAAWKIWAMRWEWQP